MDGKRQTGSFLSITSWYTQHYGTGIYYNFIINISLIYFGLFCCCCCHHIMNLSPLSVMNLWIYYSSPHQFLSPARCNLPSLGKTMRYSALHCGQATRAVLLPRCFSSTQRCRQAWWTHLVEPRQWHGRTHSAVRSSSSVAKHTQQLLKTNTHRLDEDSETHGQLLWLYMMIWLLKILDNACTLVNKRGKKRQVSPGANFTVQYFHVHNHSVKIK